MDAAVTACVPGVRDVVPSVRGVAPAAAVLDVGAHGHLEFDSLASQPRDELTLLGRRDRELESVMHLQERHDAFAPDGAHPELGVARSVALNLGVERGVDADPLQLLVKPGVFWIADALLRLFERAGTGTFSALGVVPWRPAVPMSASAVVERGLTKAHCLLLHLA